jgi:DNA-binding NarL/FixJ family response regulator
MSPRITVLICDDEPAFRQLMKDLLALDPLFEVTGEACDGPQAVHRTLGLRPDVVLMDLNMPGFNGLEATRRIKEQVPEQRVIVVSSYEEEEFGAECRQAGASGYIQKETVVGRLRAAIRRVVGAASQTVHRKPVVGDLGLAS